MLVCTFPCYHYLGSFKFMTSYIWIYLKHSHLTLQMLQLADYHENALVSVRPPKKPSIKERKQKLLTFLQGICFCKHRISHFDEFHNLKFFTDICNNYILCFSLTEKYEPVQAKWTTERCAVCRWVEDWDYNKIIICNRYGQYVFLFFLFWPDS
jgi:hypothetical protein